jgi:hypothetical protein
VLHPAATPQSGYKHFNGVCAENLANGSAKAFHLRRSLKLGLRTMNERTVNRLIIMNPTGSKNLGACSGERPDQKLLSEGYI